MVLDEPRIDLWRHTGGYSGDPFQGSRQVYRGANAVIVSGLDICDLDTVRSLDLSQYSGVITIEEPDTDDPFRTNVVPQLVLQFHDIDMTMLDYVEPEPEHVQQALTFARETDGSLLVHCRAGVSRSTAIALVIAADRLGAGNELQACEWLRQTYPQAQPNRLVVFLADEVLSRRQALFTAVTRISGCQK